MLSSLTLPRRHFLVYGLSLAVLLLLIRWLEVRYMIVDHAINIYIGAIAFMFTGLGIWLAVKLIKPKVETVVVEKEIYIEISGATQVTGPLAADENALIKTGISNRELEVLQLMAMGQSNQEIAGHLFVSLNTVKTHTSNLFMKLDVKRRTQAVDKARKLGLVS